MGVTGSVLEDLPADVVREVAAAVGGPVLKFTPVDAFFASDLAGVVTGAGGRLFVKAVRAERPMAADYRVEARVSAALPDAVPAPRLRLVVETTEWLVLGFDVVDGRSPAEPWRPGELAAVLDAIARASAALTPWPPAGHLTLADRMRGRCEVWGPLATAGRARHLTLDGLAGWERAHLDRLADLEARWETLVAGDTLLHFDLRHSNVVLDRDGSAWLVDWGRACLGPAWVDVACLLLASRFEGDAGAVFAAHPLAQGAAADAVDALLTVLLGYWTLEAVLPPHPFIPVLRQRQEASRRAALAWLRRRWDRDRMEACPRSS